jgi:transposase-like protein
VGGDISPITLEHYLGVWTGNVGPQILRSLDYAFVRQNADARTLFTGASVVKPWLDSFMERNPAYNAQSVSDFYDEASKAETAAKDLKHYQETGDIDKQIETAPLAAQAKLARKTMKTLAQMRNVIYAAENNKDMSPDDKRQIIDTTAEQMITVAKIATAMLRAGK